MQPALLNPAQRLYDIFKQWTAEPNKPAAGARSLSAEGGLETHIEAFECLRQIHIWLSESTRSGEDVTDLRQAHFEWFKAVMHVQKSWDSHATAFPEKAALNALAREMRMFTGTVNARMPDRVQLAEHLDAILELSEGDLSLDLLLRKHIRTLCEHLKQCIENWETADIFDVALSCNQLKIYCDAAAQQTVNAETRDKFNKFARFFFGGVAGYALDRVLDGTVQVGADVATNLLR